ncbi:ScyD/ScyE family protein [Rhodocytophaga rosea]|uniref:ScyD/ScyE family protein n=1 Tax=Rhodocytophaga rosea TaxID=2704465 RepID=A0A6C0GL82_9BACT|nr:ScyD/ScyE family protein [Rhodocytophaga rosea]QHT68786.1 ScyD/ScyE family protein [Rhodocytophaga rosea]
MQTKLIKLLILFILLSGTSCRQFLDYFDEVKPVQLIVKDYASGLLSPSGMVLDARGQLWVSEAGTGNNDSRISVIMPGGKVYTAIVGFSSSIFDGFPAGITHLALKDGVLWILHSGEGKLYQAEIATFKPGDSPLKANDLPSEDVGTFVKAYNFEHDTNESNLFKITVGPDDALYIADAAANAIIKRDKAGELSVFANIPGIKNPTSVGPPMLESVPTGIVFDGQKFYVTTFLGFPFPADKGIIYQVDLKGKVSVYQQGFTGLIDLDLDLDKRPVVLELGTFGEQGPKPGTGKIIRASGKQQRVIIEGLNMPTDLVKANLRTYYVNSLTDGKVLQVTHP